MRSFRNRLATETRSISAIITNTKNPKPAYMETPKKRDSHLRVRRRKGSTE